MQEELSRLINQQLRLDPAVPKPAEVPSPITYISQHYHHSAHLANPSTAQQNTASQQLTSHGIDVSVLSPAQIRLFANASTNDQTRLIEIWQIAPPKLADRNVGNWHLTTLQQEEDAARERYLQMTSPMTLGGNSMTDVFQSESQQQKPSNSQHAEPYIVNGYADHHDNTNASTAPEPFRTPTLRVIDYNRARDPVYQAKEWWTHEGTRSEPIEHQYGAYAQMSFYGTAQDNQDQEML